MFIVAIVVGMVISALAVIGLKRYVVKKEVIEAERCSPDPRLTAHGRRLAPAAHICRHKKSRTQ